MDKRIRAFDWSQTPIGPLSDWPQSLKTAVRILLNSRYPMFVWWGSELTNIYNDAYVPILGARHPQALGRSAPQIWADVWPVVGPQSEIVFSQGKATWNESILLMMERHGYTEETYFTFSYSPVPTERDDVGGLFCVCTEDTQRVVGERQLALLRDLAAKTTDVRTWQEASIRSMEALSSNPHDLPFAMLYIVQPDGTSLSLAGTSGIIPGHVAAPARATLDEKTLWPFATTFGGYDITVVDDLPTRISTPLPTGAWQQSPMQAALLPITATGQTGRGGVLIVGLNPFRFFDEDYRNFLLLVAGQISASIASAQAYEEEKKRAEALAELDRAKTTFFSNVSHEFRTPLTLMLGPVEEMLQKSEVEITPANREQLEVVHRNSLRLLKLVNTMLDFSRIEAGRLQASYEPVNLAQYTAELASVFRSAIEGAGLQLLVNCPPLSEPVYIDRDMWEKIVLNLLSNAFKFTFAGEIEVRLEALNGQAQLTVRDTGVGIPAAEMPHVFERFHRVKDARGRTHEGTGIGLALVQELVMLHGGTVRAESALNKGSQFIVSVPLGKDHLDPQHISKTKILKPTKTEAEAFRQETLRWLPDEEPDDERTWIRDDRELSEERPSRKHKKMPGPRPRILWADDNADMREYVSRLLHERFDVEAVADGQAALEAARAHPPDLILSDVMMPRLDGFGLLRALRADPQLRETPIILLSARADEETRL
ncbi:MAG: ATP-binding protein, partial [Acidiferrobacterales bacterium]|nr:ATP-binding protein [Acidiferrobacterales bacterium]